MPVRYSQGCFTAEIREEGWIWDRSERNSVPNIPAKFPFPGNLNSPFKSHVGVALEDMD